LTGIETIVFAPSAVAEVTVAVWGRVVGSASPVCGIRPQVSTFG